MEAHEAWTSPTNQGENAAVYFTLHNHSSRADELIGASTNVAESVEIHQTVQNGNVMQMVPLTTLPVKAFADMAFASDGLHLMLINLKRNLKLGDEFEVTLHFKNSPDIKVRVSVRDTPLPEENHSH